MLKVLYDHQTFSLQKYGGISRYFANVHHAIQQQIGIEASISLLYSNNYYIKDIPNFMNKSLGKFLLSDPDKCYKWNKRYSRRIIGNNDFDIFHPTYYHPYFLKKLKKPFVITVHDMIHEKYPEYFTSEDPSSYYKRQCIEKASHIIAISESTKNDIQQYLNIPEEKISVIHHGYQPIASYEKNDLFDLPEQYLLYVGDRRAYKNFYGFIRALVPLLKNDPILKIICAGGGSFQLAEIEFLSALGLSNQVVQKSVSDYQLAMLYKNAIAFVYPSFYEGFGLPILEAFGQNCPIIASNNSCFKEIAGDACQYFNPNDPSDILKSVEAVKSSFLLRSNLVSKGNNQLLTFGMDKCVNKTIELYKNLV